MNKILTYSFSHDRGRNISSEVMKKIQLTDYFVINCTTNKKGLEDFKTLLNLTMNTSYKYIIGIGVYTGKSSIVKIERLASNKFRNDKVIKKAPITYEISEFILNHDLSLVESTKMGNSWCNMTAFVIRHQLTTFDKLTLNGFIHIPNKIENVGVYSKLIQEVIKDLK